jgi:phosphoglycerate kinase
MKLKTLNKNIKLRGKKVLLRVDLNVKIGIDKTVDKKEDFKLQRVLPTINYLTEQGAIVILLSHLGRPKGRYEKNLSLLPVVKRLISLLGCQLPLLYEKDFNKLQSKINKLKNGQIVVLENLRFYKGEDSNDKKFAKQLASLGDIYINDAFAVSHRIAASLVAITEFLPAYAGFLMSSEITELTKLIKKKLSPFITILGGSKISTKIHLVEKFLKISNYVMLGGGLANNFLLADGKIIGQSIVEKKYLATIKKVLKKYRKKILLPIDVTVDNVKTKPIETWQKPIDSIKPNEKIIDIGTNTVRAWSKIIKQAKMIVWNGPLGIVEDRKASHASRALAELIAARSKGSCYSVVGGGETVWLIQDMKIFDSFDYVSTGGGAMIEFLEGKSLPGIIPLIKK